MLLTVLTVAVSFVDMGVFNTFIALAIAITKAMLVILFFMHVKYSSHVVKLYAATGFVWLLILFAFVMSDVCTRNWIHAPQPW
ncbi:MAG: cytochrome c oxidase subunit 4 [Candidatus Omnitrophota bacterium]|jgi:cytochrome c oxidase subunit 4